MIGLDLTGNWRMYAAVLPPGLTPLGTVSIGARTGALVRSRAGLYALLCGGAVSLLPQRQVAACLRRIQGTTPPLDWGPECDSLADESGGLT
jgi:hypothetical protein